MIDKFQRLALAIHVLRLPAVVVGLMCVGSVVVIVLTSRTNEGDRFLIPSVVGAFWAMSAHTFITTFRSVPEKADKSLAFYAKLKLNVIRGLYWLVGLVFLGSTVATLSVTNRLVSIWLSEYGD